MAHEHSIAITHDGFKVEKIGGVMLALEFWDCECDTDYIHSNDEDQCEICGATREDQPHSRVGAVRGMFHEVEMELGVNDEGDEL